MGQMQWVWIGFGKPRTVRRSLIKRWMTILNQLAQIPQVIMRKNHFYSNMKDRHNFIEFYITGIGGHALVRHALVRHKIERHFCSSTTCDRKCQFYLSGVYGATHFGAKQCAALVCVSHWLFYYFQTPDRSDISLSKYKLSKKGFEIEKTKKPNFRWKR